jgi:hypothetical protein
LSPLEEWVSNSGDRAGGHKQTLKS